MNFTHSVKIFSKCPEVQMSPPVLLQNMRLHVSDTRTPPATLPSRSHMIWVRTSPSLSSSAHNTVDFSWCWPTTAVSTCTCG